MKSFKQFISETIISPSTESGIMSFWHGGNLDDAYNESMNHKKGRSEFGPGLYLTTHYDTAKKYAKGSRKLYLIYVRHGTDIDDVKIHKDKIISFINEYVIKSKIKELLVWVESKIKNDEIPTLYFCNMIVNTNAIKSSNTGALRTFLVQNGIDYNIVDNAFGWHEKMLVLYNMKLIVKKQVIGSKDKIEIFDLPTKFN